jgi:hypothetical protein
MANPSVFFPDPPERHSVIEALASSAAAIEKGAERLTSGIDAVSVDALSLFPEEASLGAAAAADSLVQPTLVETVVDAEKVILAGFNNEVARLGEMVSALEARIAKLTEKDQPLAVGEVRARQLEHRGVELTAQLQQNAAAADAQGKDIAARLVQVGKIGEQVSGLEARIGKLIDHGQLLERADGIVGRLEHRLAETTAELKRAGKAQDDLGREVARLHQQLETLRDSARKQVQAAARGPSSPSKPWVTMGIVAGVTAVALTGIIASRSAHVAPQERNGPAERSAVAASLPALPATPLGFATSGMQTLPAASRTRKNGFNERRIASNGNKPAVAPVPKQVTRPTAERSSNASVVKAPRPAPEFVGALEVQSDPVGSAVFVDRRYIGETPVQLTELRAGSHIVWIQRDGYQRWTASVLVPAEKRTRVTATLQPDRNHH